MGLCGTLIRMVPRRCGEGNWSCLRLLALEVPSVKAAGAEDNSGVNLIFG